MDDKGFPPRLAQAGANLETRYSVTPRSMFFYYFPYWLAQVGANLVRTPYCQNINTRVPSSTSFDFQRESEKQVD